MADYTIPLSSAPLRRHLAVSAVLVLLACAIITFFFYYAVSAAPNLQRIFVTILWIGMVVLWGLGALLAIKNHSSTKYILTDEALVIKKKGWIGKGTKRLYRYDMIMSVHSESRAYGAYGSLELQVKHQHPAVTMHGVLLPDEHAQRIKKLIHTS